jgi:hypothetical protein
VIVLFCTIGPYVRPCQRLERCPGRLQKELFGVNGGIDYADETMNLFNC